MIRDDLLDDLRDANPVDAGHVELPATLTLRVLHPDATPRPRRRLVRAAAVAAAAAAALAVVLLVIGNSPGPADLAARAYAAAGGGGAAGIVHWRVDLSSTTPAGKVCCRQRTEGFKLGATMHVVHYDVVHGKAHVTSDSRTVGHHTKAWLSGSDDYVSVTVAKKRSMASEDVTFRTGDPLVAFRAAYRAGRLRDLGGGRFDVGFKHMAPGTVVYEVDPATGRPRRLVTSNPNGSKSIMSFSLYETLPDTPAHHARLMLLPHPGAGPGHEVAADHFRALREGPLPAPADRAQLRKMAHMMGSGRYHLDPGGIRVLADDLWLIPGRGYVCLVARSPASKATGIGLRALGGMGGGCVTVRKALKDGIANGSPAGVVVAVPDDVAAIEARYRWHGPWKRVPAPGGVARLPKLGYQVRLAR